MNKRFLSLLLTLALLLCAASGLGEQTPDLSTAKMNALRKLAGDAGTPWNEGTRPTPDMNALQVWQWTDWFLAGQVRSLLGIIQDYDLLDTNNTLDPGTEEVQWILLDMENTLSRFEALLEEDRLAILNGISLYQSDEASEEERQHAARRTLEAESEIRQIIQTICGDYETYLARVNECSVRLDNQNADSMLAGHLDELAKAASDLEKIENGANADFDISVISRYQFKIRVEDSKKNAISGAQITVTNQKNTAKTLTLPTDGHGNAVFWVSDMGADEHGELQLTVRIKANGYRTREVQTVKLRGGETATYRMEKDNGEPYLIMGCFNGRDVLTESNTYYHTAKNERMQTFSVKLHCDKDGKLELRYPKKAGSTEYNTEVRTFKASDSDKTVFEFKKEWLKTLEAGAEVSFRITSDGQAYTYDTQMKIQEAVVEEPFFSKSALFTFFGGSGGFGFNIPGEVPFIGGSRLSINIPGNKPQLMLLPSGQALFAWGRDFENEELKWKSQDAQDEARAIKEFEARGKADKLLAQAGAYRDANMTTKPKMLGNIGASVTPFVALQGLYNSSENSLEMRGNAGVMLAFKAGFTQTFTVGPVPFFAGVDFSMGANFGADITLEAGMKIENGELKILSAPVIGYGTGFGISFRLELGGTIGMGLKDVASVAMRGYGYINPIVEYIVTDSTRIQATAKLGMGMSVTVRLLFLKWQSTIWEDKIALDQINSAMALNAPTAEGEYKHFDNTGADVPRTPKTDSITYGSSGVEPVETGQVFSQLDSATGDLQYAVIGGQTYLFWIQPGSAKAQARLMWYNLNNGQNGEVKWLDKNTIEQKNEVKRGSLADYDFAVEVSRGLDNQPSSFCALTILSGKFFGTSSGESAEEPDYSILTTVLMKQNDKTKGLEIVCYQEHDKVLWKDNHAVMPEVFLTAMNTSKESVYIVSTCTSSDGQKDIYGQVIYKDKTGLDGREVIGPGSFKDGFSIARYHVGIPDATQKWPDEKVNIYSLNQEGQLSRLSYRVSRPSRDVLVEGEDIINFRVYSQLEGGIAKDRLFYLERVKKDGEYVNRLRCVTVDLNTLAADPVKPDYGVEISTDRFDIVKFGTGVYLYWTECSTPSASARKDAKEKYLVRCLRYDPKTDTISGPFSMVELSESPNSIKLQDSGTGFYSVDLQSSQGSYLRQSLTKFTYKLVSAAELTAATPDDPSVCAGDYAEIAFSVRNTGNVPLSGLNVKIKDGSKEIQTLHIDCTDPKNNSSAMGTRVMNGAYTVSRISGMYDALNNDSWEITQTNADGTTTVRSVKTTMLMPGDTHCYRAKMLVPTDWDGDKTLTAEISSVEGDVVMNGAMENGVLMLTGAGVPQGLQAANDPIMISRPDTGAQLLHTDVHDLSLSAQRFRLNGEDYVRVSIKNLSGNTESSVTPILTSSYRGETLFRHEFRLPMGDDFGYSMDIPLRTLTKGRSLPEMTLNVSTARDYDEFADSDNHVRLLLTVQLCIVEQPQSIPVSVGQEAAFSVTAAGGDAPYRYQWQRMTGTDRWEDIPDARQNTYRIASVKTEQNGLTVRCVVTDQFGCSVTSDSATLTILPQTGDSSQMTMWLLLALTAAVLAVACGKARRR